MSRYYLRILVMIFSFTLLCSSVFPSELQTPKAAIPNTYFGLHIHHLDFPTPTPWPNLPVPAWRLWDAGVCWPDLQPNRGEWRFDRLDRFIALAQKHGTGILLVLGGSPSWASARPNIPSPYQAGFSAEPANIEDWRTYVRTVVSRYKGRISAYEIWNEPNLKDFWSGSTEQMVLLTKEAAQIIHTVDPRALVVSPSATADFGIPWLEEFLKKGGGQFVDVIGYHLYVANLPEELVLLIQRVQQVISGNGLGNRPLWNTESGWIAAARPNSEDLEAGILARAYILAWAAGVQRFYWYAWDNQTMGITTYKEAEHRVTPAGHAYESIQQWLVGARMESCVEDAEHTWVCQLSRARNKQWLVWNPQGNHKFDIPAAWKAKVVTQLLGEPHPLAKPGIEIGPIPTLISASL